MTNLLNSTLAQSESSKPSLKNDFNKRIGNHYCQRFSRFNSFRKGYSILQNQLQSLNPTAYKKRLQMSDKSIFAGLEADKFVADLEETSVSYGLQLPANMTTKILEFATRIPSTEPGFDDEFIPEDVQNGRLRGGRYVMRGLVSNVMDCPAIQQLVHDSLLLEIVRKYLKYWPTMITQHLTWSFASDLSEAEIQKIYPPTNFHYDVAGYNFMTSYFYITDVDADSGPHVMIKKSRDQKPLSMLLASNLQTDDAVYNHYGKDSEIVITGKSGFGFVQDPSCIHKVKPPTTSNRLLLQIRYS
ncbi:hypothetical protein [Cylindrospermum sp. FACHB-282]|uniref:hypothetical protein n=1 Tax=Cylindrospermum sp. FACHB-282 TaxID=2692794 RepID=UPI001682855D|nr:hypothetical protein [Cylindrospermum sp. FACHB-282]MBD2386697.1 hypothetical protein [Cylindrospermum sp. FACHB-282]